ncbi:MAG: TatD family hydrolase [Candidatus Anstonellaceae archaeon]
MEGYTFADAHCHVESCSGPIPPDILIISCGTSHQTNLRNAKIAQEHPNVYICAGISPQEAIRHKQIKVSLVEWEEAIEKEIAPAGKLVGIGEIGLDYYWGKTEEEKYLQHECFISQLQLAERLGLPVVVHSRQAEKECVEILENFNLHYLLHCFSGDAATAAQATSKNGWISVPPLRSGRRKELISLIPPERILAESDAPAIGKSPSDTFESIKLIAEAKNWSVEEAKYRTLFNTISFFNIGKR